MARVPLLIAALQVFTCSALAQETPAVTTAPVGIENVAPSYEFVGRVEAISSVDIRARVDGFIEAQKFDDGQVIRQGQELFLIEPAAFEIALKDAQAVLLSAQAILRDAQRNLDRNQSLSGQAVSAAVREASETARDTAQASLMSAEAKVRQTELNLSYTHIASPIQGRIGKSAFAVGSLVGPSSSPLARVVDMDPIRVVFSVSDRAILDLRAASDGAAKDDLAQRFVARLRLSNGEQFGPVGKIEFSGNEVDPQTASLPIRALFANENALLVPGQFVSVIIRPIEEKRRPVVPMVAVSQDREGRYVLTVDAAGKVERRGIVTSDQRGQMFVVEKGLQGGETIVVEGMQNAAPGTLVSVSGKTP